MITVQQKKFMGYKFCGFVKIFDFMENKIHGCKAVSII